MKEAISILLRDRLIRQSSIISLFFLLICLVAIGFSWIHLPPLVPLYNQATWGDARLAAKQLIFLPILLALVFMVINFILSRFVLNSMPLIARFFIITAMFCSCLVLIFLLRTFQLII